MRWNEARGLALWSEPTEPADLVTTASVTRPSAPPAEARENRGKPECRVRVPEKDFAKYTSWTGRCGRSCPLRQQAVRLHCTVLRSSLKAYSRCNPVNKTVKPLRLSELPVERKSRSRCPSSQSAIETPGDLRIDLNLPGMHAGSMMLS